MEIVQWDRRWVKIDWVVLRVFVGGVVECGVLLLVALMVGVVCVGPISITWKMSPLTMWQLYLLE